MTTATEVKERPILMSGAMVRATLAKLKTQTRRPVKFDHKPWLSPLPVVEYARDGMPIWWSSPPTDEIRQSDFYDHGYPCPLGKVGDRLWVRESFYIDDIHWLTGPLPKSQPDDLLDWQIYYAADGTCCEQIPECSCAEVGKPKWRPSIHMPRWACRLVLEITDVRVQRLNSISEADARAEGIVECDIPADEEGPLRIGYMPYPDDGKSGLDVSPIGAFCRLWESIYGKGSWARNDWTWALTFKLIQPARAEA